MNIRTNRRRGACLLELMLGILLVLGIALFVITFGWRMYQALRAYIQERNDRIQREIGDERDEPVTFYRHTEKTWA